MEQREGLAFGGSGSPRRYVGGLLDILHQELLMMVFDGLCHREAELNFTLRARAQDIGGYPHPNHNPLQRVAKISVPCGEI